MIINTVVNNYLFGPESDPQFSSTILLNSGEGTVGNAAHEPDLSFAARGNGTAVGAGATDASYSNAAFVFGATSVRFDSARNDAVEWADHADWTLGTSDFTIEGFFFHDENTVNETLCSHTTSTGNQRGWNFRYAGAIATDALEFSASSDGATLANIVTGAWTPTISTWYYYCVERSGNDFRIYAGPLNGTASMLAKAANAISIFNANSVFRWGATGTFGDPYRGYMDERRITLAARYATDAGFAVPTAEFPRS